MSPGTALVTGGGRGIGAACARRLATDGWDVALTWGNDAEPAEAVAAEIRESGRAAAAFRLEARADDPAEVLATVEDALGPIGAAVLNAGLTRDGVALRMSDDAWDEVVAVNLTGSFRAARAVLRGMLKRRAGSIVVISSIVGRAGNPGQVNYAASKAGLGGMARSLAREAGGRGVRINTVEPGFIQTRLTDVLADDQREALLAATGLGRLGTPEDVAGPVAFLCSDRSAFITGATLAVDGGLEMAGAA